jgi:glycosyltransferase involved in cell wall biosynthesis
MKRLKILFLTEGRHTPSSRLRVRNYLRLLDPECYAWKIRPIPNSIFSRPSLFVDAHRADLVFIQKKLFHSWELPFLSGRLGMIYDFDDMVMLPGRDKYKPEDAQSGKRRRRFERTIAQAKIVITGSQYLKEQVGAAQTKALIIPTPVDSVGQPVKHHAESNRVVMGWIGTRGNLHYLKDLEPVFSRLAKRFPGLTLMIVSDGFFDPEGISILKKNWCLDEETADLLRFDLGLMPLSDDPWARGKCGFKILQYMSAGLPVVASPVGVNTEIIRHDENGLLAADHGEWESSLERLIRSVELRRRLGEAGRQTIRQRYDLRSCAVAFRRAIDKAGGRI